MSPLNNLHGRVPTRPIHSRTTRENSHHTAPFLSRCRAVVASCWGSQRWGAGGVRRVGLL